MIAETNLVITNIMKSAVLVEKKKRKRLWAQKKSIQTRTQQKREMGPFVDKQLSGLWMMHTHSQMLKKLRVRRAARRSTPKMCKVVGARLEIGLFRGYFRNTRLADVCSETRLFQAVFPTRNTSLSGTQSQRTRVSETSRNRRASRRVSETRVLQVRGNTGASETHAQKHGCFGNTPPGTRVFRKYAVTCVFPAVFPDHPCPEYVEMLRHFTDEEIITCVCESLHFFCRQGPGWKNDWKSHSCRCSASRRFVGTKRAKNFKGQGRGGEEWSY
jgi:hypothetical protein